MLLYKCDGCGLEAEVARPASLPAGWRQYPGNESIHACPECFKQQSAVWGLQTMVAGAMMAAGLGHIFEELGFAGFAPPGRGGQKGPKKSARKRLKTKILEAEILP